MKPGVLALNAGSSSIKYALFQTAGYSLYEVDKGQVERSGPGIHYAKAIANIITWVKSHPEIEVRGIGHRVAHGGQLYTQPTLITDEIIDGIKSLTHLAPLHQQYSLDVIKSMRTAFPEIPQVACFDTAFHANRPEIAKLFALPKELTEKGIIRYGFHGLSYEFIVRCLADYTNARRLVVLHLGSGCSMCAINDGKPVDSTMGFSTLEGLPMGTRTGSIDPGVIFYMVNHLGYTLKEVEEIFYRKSGLLGVSGISSDMREVLTTSTKDAVNAYHLFVYEVAKKLGALAMTLGGVDAVVFTGGIGENSPEVRHFVCDSAEWLGLELDTVANVAGKTKISKDTSKVSAWVIPTNEERMIAEHTLNKVGVA